ncbi:MAG: mechanosensitive ion channel protein [Desulfuromonas sp.]|nr:MAG: mechanosensitive ion channel protein [Desulfuromonas sp.]
MEQLDQFWASNSVKIISVGYQLFLALAVFFASRLAAKLVRKSIQRANFKIESLDETMAPVLGAIGSYSVYAIGLVIVLDIFGVNTNSIIALLGAAGLAVGLALKDTLSNIAAGIMLLILRPFKVNHFIECGSYSGTVKEIGLFTTILETIDGLFLSMPNSTLWGVPIKNFTCNGKRRMDLVVGISYGDSIDRGFEVLKGIIEAESRFHKEPAPKIMVQTLGDSSVNLQLRAWASVDDYWDVIWEHNKVIKEKIEAAGLTIPFPQRDVHLHEMPKAGVQV